MKTLTSIATGRLFLLALTILLTLGLALAPVAEARKYISNGGVHHGGGTMGEGDPLDANDFGDDPFEDIHDNATLVVSPPRSVPVVQASLFGGTFLISMDYRGSFPVLHFINISDLAATAEGTDAR